MRATPRKFPIIDRFTYLKIEQSEWPKKDEMIRFFRHYRKSLTHGRLVLAAIVQANSNLFKPGPNNHPALIAYDLEGQAKPEDPVQLARRIYHLRSSEPSTEEEQKLADHLNDEMKRSLGWPVPSSYAPAGSRPSTSPANTSPAAISRTRSCRSASIRRTASPRCSR